MKRILPLLLVTLLIMLGCGTSQWTYKHVSPADHISNAKVIPIYIDSTFSDEHAKAIKDSIAEWNLVLNKQITLKLDSTFVGLIDGQRRLDEVNRTGLGYVIINLEETSPILSGLVEEGDGTLAFVRRFDGHVMVIVGDRIGNRNLKTIVMHEIGHLLGSFHVNIPGSLMMPYYGNDQADCIDKVTVAQVAGYNHLLLEHLNYCVTPNFK
jgi:hypothetical protein